MQSRKRQISLRLLCFVAGGVAGFFVCQKPNNPLAATQDLVAVDSGKKAPTRSESTAHPTTPGRSRSDIMEDLARHPSLMSLFTPSFISAEGKIDFQELKAFDMGDSMQQLESLIAKYINIQRSNELQNYQLLKRSDKAIMLYLPAEPHGETYESYMRELQTILGSEGKVKFFKSGTDVQLNFLTGNMGKNPRVIKITKIPEGYFSDIKIISNNSANILQGRSWEDLEFGQLWKHFEGSEARSAFSVVPDKLSHLFE